MRELSSSFQRLSLCLVAILAAGCSAEPSTSQLQTIAMPAGHSSATSSLDASTTALTSPALVAVNQDTKALEFWPITLHGSHHPQPLSKPGLFNGFGMAAHGHVVVFANQSPPQIVLFDVLTKTEHTLPDPYGLPIDIAIGKDASIYVDNSVRGTNNITMYPGGSGGPQKLVCKHMYGGQEVAVDNEGDIFVNGYGRGFFMGVVEIPNGPSGPEPQNCRRLHLQPEEGYVAGLAIDPKTEALIVLDNPGACAGGEEGRMTIYPKPYDAATGVSHDVGVNCSGGLRLNADSTVVFVLDQDFAGVNQFILQRSYPDGAHLGAYNGGRPTSITTIPNVLPN